MNCSFATKQTASQFQPASRSARFAKKGNIVPNLEVIDEVRIPPYFIAECKREGGDMPIFEYLCRDCGKLFEDIQTSSDAQGLCPTCGKPGERILSATSSLSGKERQSVPGSGDHGCCGSSPSNKGCVPGSCCGRSVS